ETAWERMSDARSESRASKTGDPPARLTLRGKPRNLVVVLLESTRYTATTLGNSDLATTPFLAEMAGTSLVADRAYAVVPHTSKAVVSTLCGLEPPLHVAMHDHLGDEVASRCLPRLLAGAGYRTAYFQSSVSR